MEEIVISSDCTIGGETSGEANVHGKVVEALSGNKVFSPRETNSVTKVLFQTRIPTALKSIFFICYLSAEVEKAKQDGLKVFVKPY